MAWTSAVTLLSAAVAGPALSGYYPMFASWPQPGGPASPIALRFAYSNLMDGSVLDGATLGPMDAELMHSAFEVALSDYTAHLPIHFVETVDVGPLPETGEYDPTGLAEIRIGQVLHIDGANAYAYFPVDPMSGLSGDIVFNAERSGLGWSPILFYAVAQHELGHSLGMGHYEDCSTLIEATVDQVAQQSPYEGPQIPLAPLMIEALQSVYGAGTGTVTALPEPRLASAIGAGALLLALFGRRHPPGSSAPGPDRQSWSARDTNRTRSRRARSREPRRKTMRMLLILFALITASSTATALPLVWVEDVDGDLSGDRLAPTPLAFDVGTNLVSGTMGLVAGEPFDADVFHFDVGDGTELVGIDLLSLDPVGDIEVGIFVAIAAGDSIAPFDATQHMGDALVAMPGDVLAQLETGTLYGAPGFSAPLGAGTYTFWIQESTTSADYSLAFTVVPEPSAALLLGLGLSALSLGRRGRCSGRASG